MTNPFTPLDPPGDTTNRTPKMLAGFRGKTIDNGVPVEPNPPAGILGSPLVWEHVFFNEYGRVANMGLHDEAEEDVECAARIVDNSKGVYGRMESHITEPGALNSEFAVKYSPSLTSVSWSDFGPKLTLRAADLVVPKRSNPILLPENSRIKDLLIKLVRRGGNGILTPEMWNAIVSVTSGTPPGTPGGGPPGDLPEDATWGDVIFDVNVNGPLFQALGYGDGDDVNLWPDETGIGNDMATVATLLLPTYQATGFASGLPCIQWAGSNVPLSTPNNPTRPVGSYTYYFVIDGLDGGDGARIWGAGLGDSFQYSYYADGDTVYSANNNLFGSPSIFAEDDWGMADPHIYRFTKNSGSASHHIFVDGILKGSAGAAPQLNNDGTAWMMDYMTGLGLSGKIGRAFAYNQNHPNATGTGAEADGLTAPELVIRAFWGTP